MDESSKTNSETGNGSPGKSDISKNELVTVLGGIELEVAHKPAEAFEESELKEIEKFLGLLGTRETIKIWQIRSRDIPRYHSALANEEKCVELFCRKDPGWALTLESSSFEKIMDTGQELNIPFWLAWHRRWMAREEALVPGSTNILKKAVDAAVAAVSAKQAASVSPDSSPKSA